jgi:hypothetical protein
MDTKTLKANLKVLNRNATKIRDLTEKALVTLAAGKKVKPAVSEKIGQLEEAMYDARTEVETAFFDAENALPD